MVAAEKGQSSQEGRFCAKCGNEFSWEDDPQIVRIFGRSLAPIHCDDCEKILAVASQSSETLTAANRERLNRERLEAAWVAMVGPYFTGFNAAMLPPEIRPHVRRVMAWDAKSTKGIGFLGATNAGKSRVIHALGYRLHMAGEDVFATSGIEFQDRCLSQVRDSGGWADYLKQCAQSSILILDDADKLRLTDAVEAAYYGMLEKRRRWCLPVLATLNLSGDELAASGSANRGGPIVTRLRDLCEIISL